MSIYQTKTGAIRATGKDAEALLGALCRAHGITNPIAKAAPETAARAQKIVHTTGQHLGLPPDGRIQIGPTDV